MGLPAPTHSARPRPSRMRRSCQTVSSTGPQCGRCPVCRSVRAVRLRAATALTGLALISACSGSSNPRTLPTLTPTPTTSGTEVLPAAATPNTSQGLDAFVRFYFDQLNAAFATSNAELIRGLSSPECETCENYARSLGKDGNHIVGVTFANVEVAAPPLQPSGTIVEVTGLVPPRKVVNASGQVVKSLPSGGTFHFQINVLRTATGWAVRGIRRAGS